jgi:hypothetical protein
MGSFERLILQRSAWSAKWKSSPLLPVQVMKTDFRESTVLFEIH